MGTKLERGMASEVKGLPTEGTGEYEDLKRGILKDNETADEDEAIIGFKSGKAAIPEHDRNMARDPQKGADFELTEGLIGRELAEKHIAITKRLRELEDGVTEDVLAEGDPEVLYAFYVADWLDKTDKGYVPQNPNGRNSKYRYFKKEGWGGPEKGLEKLVKTQLSFSRETINQGDDILQKFTPEMMKLDLISNAWNNITDVIRMNGILKKYFPELEGKLAKYLERLREFENLVAQTLDFLGLQMVVPKLLEAIPKQDSDRYDVDSSWLEDEKLAKDHKIMEMIKKHHWSKKFLSPLISDIRGVGIVDRSGVPLSKADVVVYFPPSK